MSRVVVFDYGSGNIHSATRALASVGADVVVSSDRTTALEADGLVVPGVGAFAACMDQLAAHDGIETLRHAVAAGQPMLCICVAHQILFSRGVEHGVDCEGVGIFPGTVRLLPTTRVPHMGWNEVKAEPKSTYFTTTDRFYFVHSYAALTKQDCPPTATVMWAEHEGVQFVAAVEDGPLLSTQFHPEKSGRAGLALIQRWVDNLGAA